MRPVAIFLALGAVMVLLAVVAIGAMVSIGAGRPNWLLIGVFAADSLALLLIAWYATVRRNGAGP